MLAPAAAEAPPRRFDVPETRTAAPAGEPSVTSDVSDKAGMAGAGAFACGPMAADRRPANMSSKPWPADQQQDVDILFGYAHFIY